MPKLQQSFAEDIWSESRKFKDLIEKKKPTKKNKDQNGENPLNFAETK